MTPAEAYDLTRDVLVSALYAQARAQGLAVDVGQVTQMADTALERSGFRAMAALLQEADAAAQAYAATYAEPPPELIERDESWRARRSALGDYENLTGLITL